MTNDDWIEALADAVCEQHADTIAEWDEYDGS